MKLQIALDRLTREECLQVLNDTKYQLDIIEVGTGVIKEYGMAIVREIRTLFPSKIIVADMKTCDAGGHEAKQAFEAGADITTVMAFSSNLTITDTLKVAETHGKRVMVDLLEVTDTERVKELAALGVDLVSLHVGKDKQKEGKFDTKLFDLVADSNMEVTVAGGINQDSLPEIMKKAPDTVIIGSAITKSSNPHESAEIIKEMLNERS
ncbi:3-hexulose-6-phosphate synthase [Virgibacillus flavescens]|uniref:3-hexulose-6-phosphate synthase n=1 Tax=Virgibacillus flavescens TaxID=1611422 RepID=UPI003D344805